MLIKLIFWIEAQFEDIVCSEEVAEVVIYWVFEDALGNSVISARSIAKLHNPIMKAKKQMRIFNFECMSIFFANLAKVRPFNCIFQLEFTLEKIGNFSRITNLYSLIRCDTTYVLIIVIFESHRTLVIELVKNALDILILWPKSIVGAAIFHQ